MAIKIAGVDVINDDRELVLAKLTDINSTISSTAVDVFVYDTSKDSDGGAWRHRTQHTSWYAEASSASRDANTRSTRAEFPAVAVIVAEEHTITIYDGDDPSLPMWMVFPQNSGALGGVTSAGLDLTSVAMLNGVLVGGYGNGLSYVNFLSEVLERGFNVNTSNVGVMPFNVAERDQSPVGLGGALNLEIVNSTVNDVAMTVLPDAPTDPATGLPVPTIAVMTAGGISVIRHDGSVLSASSPTNQGYRLAFDDLGGLYWSRGADGGVYYAVDPTVSLSTFSFGVKNNSLGNAGAGLPRTADNTIAYGANTGLARVQANLATTASAMVAYATSTYTTGWMPGDIKLAALADTTAETLSGSELVTSFTNNTSFPFETFTSSGDTISSAINTTGFGIAYASVTLTAGKTYVISGDVTLNSGSAPNLRSGTSNPSLPDIISTSVSGSFAFTITPTTTVTEVGFRAENGVACDFSATLSVRLADPDRSVNGNGLSVHGSITKAAVATGADLVAYSNFSSSNYLEQPYNADLNFGTGDFCVMGWVKGASSMSTATIVSRCSSASDGFHLFKQTTSISPYARLRIGSTYLNGTTGITDQWNHLVAMRKDGVAYIYKNGVLENSASISTDVSGSFATEIGWSTADTLITSLAGISLLRISATAPTADQIAKIYNDEKVLFQDSAKATLTGSSDAVTALAHDPDTELLHVGTSAGRSVFQGLRRVEEHTGTNSQSLVAISAVDGLVVEGK